MIQAISGRFRGLYHTVLGSGVDLNGSDPVTRVSYNRKKIRDSDHFWPFSWAIAHGFGVRGGLKRSGTP